MADLGEDALRLRDELRVRRVPGRRRRRRRRRHQRRVEGRRRRQAGLHRRRQVVQVQPLQDHLGLFVLPIVTVALSFIHSLTCFRVCFVIILTSTLIHSFTELCRFINVSFFYLVSVFGRGIVGERRVERVVGTDQRRRQHRRLHQRHHGHRLSMTDR